jgi:ABC-2 type transport system permease protein/sodium transport system permease protein
VRRAEEPSDQGSIPAALWCLALAMPFHFILVGLLRQLSPSPAALLGLIAVASLVQFVGVPAFAAYVGRVRWAPGFGLNPPRPAALLAGLLLGGSLWPLLLHLLEFVTTANEGHEELLAGMRQSREGIEGLLLFSTVVAAVAEELFFRGFLFHALRARTNAWLTIGATALLFGLTHVFLGGALGIERLLPSTLLGLVLGTLCWLTRSVWPGLILHVTHNTCLVLFGQTEWAQANQIPPIFFIAGAVGTLAGLAVLWLAGRRSSPDPS